MIRKVLLFIFVSNVVSDSCVRYTFEEDFNELFTPQRGFCISTDTFWVVGKYNEIDLSNENDQSTTFITPVPQPAISCASSFSFSMAPGGTIEVNTYISTGHSEIWVTAYRLDVVDRFLGQTVIRSGQQNFVPGWHTLKIILSTEAIGDGYISILGGASSNSTALVDSFRYIPPGMEESACRLYEDKPEPVPSTLEPTTPDPTTPEETTPDPTTPEITTPDPITPEVTTAEPTTPDATTPDVTTLEPITPEVTTPDPTTPEVTTPKPTTPESTTPDPITPEETTPDPTTPEVTTPENIHQYLLTIETWIKTQFSMGSKTM